MTNRLKSASAALALAATACHSAPSSALDTRTVTLPDGFEVAAEIKISPADMAKGMMYRDELASGHGMLFVHDKVGLYPYWMANCRIPLDIVWIDSDHRVVEISAATPPCPAGGTDCPTFGGHERSQYVLEIGGGEAARRQVKVGSVLRF